MIRRLIRTAGAARLTMPATPTVRRRLVIHKDDILCIGNMELDAAILRKIVSPDNRVLWAVIKQGDDIKPRCYGEDEVIWLTQDEVNLGTEI